MWIAESARRHGVSDEAIRHAVASAVRVVPTDDALFIVGVDPAGRMLEIVARPLSDEGLLVFRAMPLRPVNARRCLP